MSEAMQTVLKQRKGYLKMNKTKKIITIFILILLGLSWFYYHHYRIFLSPPQILSMEEIEKNKQGICLAENRKLSEDELFNRGMQSYFTYLKTAKIPQDEDWEVMLDHCRENCVVTQLANYNLLDYLRLHRLNFKEKREDRKIKAQGEKVNSFPLTELKQHVSFKNKQDNLFSLYINQSRWPSFYPNDCCEVNALDFYTQNGFSLKNMPKDWRSIGKGNFYLTAKYLSVDTSDGSVTLEYETMPLDNCGNIYREYFNQNEGGRDFKNPNITDSNFFIYWEEWNYIPKETLNNQCILLDSKLSQSLEGYKFIAYNNRLFLCSLKVEDIADWK